MTTKTEEQSPNAASPAIGFACYKKSNKDETTLMDDIKDYMDAIYSASMEEHKTCFKNTINKMVEKSKEIIGRFSQSNAVDSSVSLEAEKK